MDEYLVDLNATQSAIRAGYSPKTAPAIGAENLTKPEIAAAIDTAKAARSERVEVSTDYVVRTLAEVVERCMQRAPVTVRRGRETVQFQDEAGRSVWQFDAKGANGALGLLGKHLGMFTEKIEHSGAVGGVLAVPVPLGAAEWGTLATQQQADLGAQAARAAASALAAVAPAVGR